MRTYIWTVIALVVVFASIGAVRGICVSRQALFTRFSQVTLLAAVVILFTLAAWFRFRLPLDPIADPDLGWYLKPAVNEIVHGDFSPAPYGWCFIYPGFVYILLILFRDFRAITVAQHLFGLLGGAMLLATWLRARAFPAHPRVRREQYTAAGIIALAIFLFAAQPSSFELHVRPEGIIAFLISINVYFAVQFTVSSFIEKRKAASVVYGIACVFSSLALRDVKPSFTLFAIQSCIPVGIFFFRADWRFEKIALGLGAAVVALGIMVPEKVLSRRGDLARSYLATQVFVVHADLISDQIAEDVRRNAKLPYPHDWLQNVHRTLAEELEKTRPTNYKILGFNPVYLMFDPTSIVARLRNELGNDAAREFFTFYYRRIWLERPAAVINKLTRQMAIFYRVTVPAYQPNEFLSLQGEYVQSAAALDKSPALRELWAKWAPAAEYVQRTGSLARDAPTLSQSVYVRRPLAALAAAYLAILIGTLLSAIAVVVVSKRARTNLKWLATFAIFLFAYNAACCAVVAVANSLDNPRYLTVQMYFTMLAEFTGVWFIIETVLHFAGSLTRWRESHGGPGIERSGTKA